jgi:hypothetical protein
MVETYGKRWKVLEEDGGNQWKFPWKAWELPEDSWKIWISNHCYTKGSKN